MHLSIDHIKLLQKMIHLGKTTKHALHASFPKKFIQKLKAIAIYSVELYEESEK